jgi:hypothetical protein
MKTLYVFLILLATNAQSMQGIEEDQELFITFKKPCPSAGNHQIIEATGNTDLINYTGNGSWQTFCHIPHMGTSTVKILFSEESGELKYKMDFQKQNYISTHLNDKDLVLTLDTNKIQLPLEGTITIFPKDYQPFEDALEEHVSEKETQTDFQVIDKPLKDIL